MSINFIQLQMQYFGNPGKGTPVSNGFVYVGTIDTDPLIEINRITVVITEEDGTEVPILPSAQPLTLNVGGFIQFNGSSVQVNAASDFSIKVLDSGGSQVFYTPRVSNTIAASIVTYDNSVSGLTATDVQAALDEVALLSGAVTAWGTITGNILNQTDLQNQFAANKRLTIFTLSGASETNIAAHNNNKVNMTNSGANTFTIDPGIMVEGDQMLVEQKGTGKTTIAPGATVTLNASGGLLSSLSQYSVITIIHEGSNVYTIGGERS